jgi:hypothetical protein
MPTPNIYKQISSRILPYKWYLLGFVGLGIILCVASIFISVNSQMNYFPLFGVGFLIIIWGWGLFLICVWYGKQSKLATKFPSTVITGAEWGSSLFIDVLLLIGSIGVIFFIFNAL